MNRFRILRVSFGLVAVLLLAACTQNEMTNGNELPEGKYPLAFTATQSTATPQTRVAETTDGNGSTWTEGDQISVNINNGTQTGTYTLNADGTIKETVTPLYWQSTANATVNGWYPATDGTVNLSDQSAGLKYVLKGTGTGSYQSAPTLAFAHQLAKVRVKLTSATDLTTATVGVYSNPTCTHTKGTVTVTGTEQKSYLTMHKTTYNGVTCYEANVVPGTLEATNAFQISIGSKNTNVTLGSAVTLVAGKVHEFTLTVNKPGPLYIELKDIATDTYTFTRDGTLKGDNATYNKSIYIADGVTLTIKNVKLKAATNHHAIYGQGTATLILEETNTADGDSEYTAGVAAKTSITIKGTGSLDATGGTNAPGVGGGLYSYERSGECGNIIIESGTISSTAKWGRSAPAGIGNHCESIIIKGGNVTVTTCTDGAACIGSGLNSYCQDITISGGTITTQKRGANCKSIGGDSRGGGVLGTITISAGVIINGTTYTTTHIGEVP